MLQERMGYQDFQEKEENLAYLVHLASLALLDPLGHRVRWVSLVQQGKGDHRDMGVHREREEDLEKQERKDQLDQLEHLELLAPLDQRGKEDFRAREVSQDPREWQVTEVNLDLTVTQVDRVIKVAGVYLEKLDHPVHRVDRDHQDPMDQLVRREIRVNPVILEDLEKMAKEDHLVLLDQLVQLDDLEIWQIRE